MLNYLSLATHAEKTRETDVVFGEKSIKAQAVQVEYTTPIIYALSQLVIAYRKYTEVLEREVERKSKTKVLTLEERENYISNFTKIIQNIGKTRIEVFR